MNNFRDWDMNKVAEHNARVKTDRGNRENVGVGFKPTRAGFKPTPTPDQKIAQASAIINMPTWPVIVEADFDKRPEDRMNKTEARFAEMILEPLRLAGIIRKWEFEPFNFRVAPDRFYKPDFAGWHFDGTITVIEIKAYELHRDTITKLKVIKDKFGTPYFLFKLFQWTGGAWVQKA